MISNLSLTLSQKQPSFEQNLFLTIFINIDIHLFLMKEIIIPEVLKNQPKKINNTDYNMNLNIKQNYNYSKNYNNHNITNNYNS